MAKTNKTVFASLAFVLGLAPWPYSSLSWSNHNKKELIPPPRTEYVPGEVLVKFKSDVPSSERAQVLSGAAVLATRSIENGFALIKLAEGEAVESALQSFRVRGEIEHVQPNYIYRKFATPNDTNYGQLWGLNNASFPDNDMDLQQAWDHQTDCSSVIVAVVDSGINYTHRDLAANMWDGGAAYPNHGRDFAEGVIDNDPMPTDGDTHGTHVAGTIGAVGNNNRGTTGVCWSVKIMALRVFHNDTSDSAKIIQALQFAIANGAKIINMSLGGGGNDAAFSAQVDNARNNGVVIVAAAGNSNSSNDSVPTYPCNFPQDNVICVAALDEGYNLASFSNYGANSVDVGAPGTNILSTWPGLNIEEDFSTSWVMDPDWSGVACGPFRILANPSNWCSFGTYANNANSVSYKTFDLNGSSYGRATFYENRDLRGMDSVQLYLRNVGNNPFPAGTLIYSHTGIGLEAQSVNLGACLTSTCSIGFRLASDASETAGGVAIAFFEINTVISNADHYHAGNGTSMAAPHVTGLAALIKAYNPTLTYLDVVNAIKYGGDSVASLNGFTTTGRAVNATGSLKYINAPTNVAAKVNHQ